MGDFELQGLCIAAHPYGEWDLNLLLLSPEQGLVRVFGKGVRRPTQRSLALCCRPGSLSDWSLSKGKSDLLRLHGAELLHYPEGLRHSWKALQSAIEMLRSIADTQWTHKPDPRLFLLAVRTLQQLEQEYHPNLLLGFWAKLLLLEGSFPPARQCEVCGRGPEQILSSPAGVLCRAHAPPEGIPITEERYGQLCALAACRDFQLLRQQDLDAPTAAIIEQLWMRHLQE